MPQLIDDVSGCASLPGKQEVRFQDDELLVIDRKRVTDQWEFKRRRRIVGVSANADQFVASACCEYELSQVWSQSCYAIVVRRWRREIGFRRTATEANQGKKKCLTASSRTKSSPR